MYIVVYNLINTKTGDVLETMQDALYTRNISAAHARADKLVHILSEAASVRGEHLEKVAIYPECETPCGIMRGAVLVARATIKQGIRNGYAPDVWYTWESTLSRISGACDDLIGMYGWTDEAYFGIDDYVSRYAVQDVRDIIGYAQQGLCDGMARYGAASMRDVYKVAYSTLNAYIASMRAANEREVSQEYIMDGGGDIVPYYGAVARILKGGERWTAAAGGGMSAAAAKRLGNALARAVRDTCTPVQVDIIKRAAHGYSVRQIARMRKCAGSTVMRNLVIARKAIFERMRGGEFGYKVRKYKIAEYRADVCKRTAAGAASKAASDKATQAERARAYRARRRAAQAASKSE